MHQDKAWILFPLAHQKSMFWGCMIVKTCLAISVYIGLYSIVCVVEHAQMVHKLIAACREVRAVDKRKRGTFTREYDCCRRQTDMARRYPDDDPLRHLSSHSVALTVGLSVQRHHQHEIPAGETDTAG